MSYSQAIIDAGGLFHAPLNEAASPSSDSIASLSAPWVGTIAQTAGPDATEIPYALDLSSSAALHFVDSTTLPVSMQGIGVANGGFFVGGWIKTTASGSGFTLWYTDSVIAELREETSGGGSIPFSLSVGSGGHFAAAYNLDGSDEGPFIAGNLPVINDGAWHFVAFSRNWGTIRLFVDAEYEEFTGADLDTSMGTQVCNLTIGCRTLGSGALDSFVPGAYSGWHIASGDHTVNDVLSVYAAGGGNAHLLSSTAKKGDGAAVDAVLIRDATTGAHVVKVTPAADGTWSAYVQAGDYYITYAADGCQPICHGPYTIGGV